MHVNVVHFAKRITQKGSRKRGKQTRIGRRAKGGGDATDALQHNAVVMLLALASAE